MFISIVYIFSCRFNINFCLYVYSYFCFLIHILLNILSGFTFNIMKTGLFYFVLGLLPLLFIIAFSGLELAIAFKA